MESEFVFCFWKESKLDGALAHSWGRDEQINNRARAIESEAWNRVSYECQRLLGIGDTSWQRKLPPLRWALCRYTASRI